MYTIENKLTYYLTTNGQYYRSKRDYVSCNFTLTDYEIEATRLTDLDDIVYLLEDLDMYEWQIQINLANLCLTVMDLPTFVKLAIKGEQL